MTPTLLPLPPEPARGTAASKLAAHLDIGTIVTGLIGFLMVMLINNGLGKLEKLTEQMATLSDRMTMVVTRNEFQEKIDAQQDDRLRRQSDRITELEKLIGARR
jgi:uncharacterized membrane protein YhiD involved in acid resistance